MEHLENVGFIQIYEETFLNFKRITVLITGESQFLKNEGIHNEDKWQRPSQTKLIGIIATYSIPKNDIKLIFQHSKDNVLEATITNPSPNNLILEIICDTGVIYSKQIDLDENLEIGRKETILQGSKDWLKENNLEYF